MRYGNCIREFLNWVLAKHFSELDNYGRSVVLADFHNPFPWRSRAGMVRPYESVHSPMPYHYIRELGDLLAQGLNFRDWKYAHEAIAGISHGAGTLGDWFQVSEQDIDRKDLDCVWRRRSRNRREILEMWSPVRSVALLVKLTLPLRTFQVRMLDSGEADTWRYTSGGWVLNQRPLASGNERRPARRGVFRRIEDKETGAILTGIYVNTNKTADMLSDKEELGYVIPWQHDRLLYWLEKLRNWQEKYNPVTKMTSWTELEVKHICHPKSVKQLTRMPDTCFLFRDAASSGENRAKPLPTHAVESIWYKILGELERRCAARGETMAGGKPLKFIKSGRERVSFFPLHSLRVSLLTCLALDAEVPMVVLSKLIAGHSRLVMTLYYTKVGIARMTRMLNEASEKLDATASDGIQRFFAEAAYDQISTASVFNDLDSIKSALPECVTERNPAGWMPRHHGMCLVGGNTSLADGKNRIGGCFNGGPVIRQIKSDVNVYQTVPGGAGNCVRCRWFVTEPRYLDALRAHFNNVSYHLAEAAKVAKSREEKLEAFKMRRYAAEQAAMPFVEQAEYLRAERLWESSLAIVDQLANDLTATYRLVRRCIALIEQVRENDKGAQQLVAVGGLQDLRMAFDDTQSELLQLSGVCLDAEIYPDECPGKFVVRRSQFLDSALYREGVQPIFLTLSEEEQLRLGNRFMSQLADMAKPDDHILGLRQVVDTLEAGRSLAEIGIVDDMVEMLETALHRPLLRVSDITQRPPRRIRIAEKVQ